jgi:hypothetical protein
LNTIRNNTTKDQARNNFRFLGDWAPEETAITRDVRRTFINLGSVIFGLQRRRLLIAVSEGHPQPQPNAPSPQAPLLVLKTGSYSQPDPKSIWISGKSPVTLNSRSRASLHQSYHVSQSMQGIRTPTAPGDEHLKLAFPHFGLTREF